MAEFDYLIPKSTVGEFDDLIPKNTAPGGPAAGAATEQFFAEQARPGATDYYDTPYGPGELKDGYVVGFPRFGADVGDWQVPFDPTTMTLVRRNPSPLAAPATQQVRAKKTKPLTQDIGDTFNRAFMEAPLPQAYIGLNSERPFEISRVDEERLRRSGYAFDQKDNPLAPWAAKPQPLFEGGPEIPGWAASPVRAVGGLGAMVAGALFDPLSYLAPEFKGAALAAKPALKKGLEFSAAGGLSDLATQGVSVATGAQDEFSPEQTATAIGVGGVLGAGAGVAAKRAKPAAGAPNTGVVGEFDDLVAGAKEVASDLQGIVAPDTKAKGKRAQAIVRREAGRAEYEIALVGEKLRPLYKQIEKLDEATKAKLYNYPEATTSEKLDMMLTREQQEIGDTASAIYRKNRENVQRSLTPEEWPNFIENYAAHIWKQKADDVLRVYEEVSPTYTAKTGSGRSLLKRKFPTIKEGLAAGLELKYDNPLDALMEYQAQMSRYLKHRRILRAFKNEGLGDWKLPSEAKGEVRVEGPGTVKGVPPGYGRKGKPAAGAEGPSPSGGPPTPPGGPKALGAPANEFNDLIPKVPKEIPGPRPRPATAKKVSVFGHPIIDRTAKHEVVTAPKAATLEGQNALIITPEGRIVHLPEEDAHNSLWTGAALLDKGDDWSRVSSFLKNGVFEIGIDDPKAGWTDAGKKAALRLIAAARKAGHDVRVTIGDRVYRDETLNEARNAMRIRDPAKPKPKAIEGPKAATLDRQTAITLKRVEDGIASHKDEIKQLDRLREPTPEEIAHRNDLKRSMQELEEYAAEIRSRGVVEDPKTPMPDPKTDPAAFDAWMAERQKGMSKSGHAAGRPGIRAIDSAAAKADPKDVPLSSAGKDIVPARPNGRLESAPMPDPREDPEGFDRWVAQQEFARGRKPPGGDIPRIEGPKVEPIKKDPKPAPNLYFYAHPDAAKVINNHTKRGLEGSPLFRAINRGSNFLKLYTLALDVFHGVATTLHASANTAAEGFTEAARLRPVTAAKRFAGVPLSPVRLAWKGVKTRKQMLHRIPRSPEEKAIQDAYVQAGGRLEMDEIFKAKTSRTFYDAIQSKTFWRMLKNEVQHEWPKKPIGKTIDLTANIVQSAMAPLFQWYIPRLKLGAFSEGMKNWLARHPSANKAQTEDFARRMVDSIDNRFGEAIDDNIFWSKTLKQITRLALLSPSWNKGLISEIGGGFLDIPKSVKRALKGEDISTRTAYVLGLASVVSVINGMQTYLNTGEMPEGEDFMAYRTGGMAADGSPERALIPGHQKDVFAVAHEGVGGLPKELTNKSNPALRTGIELATNKDYRGLPIYPQKGEPEIPGQRGLLDYLVDMFIPIGVKNVQAGRNEGSKIGPIQRGAGVRQAPRFIQNPEVDEALTKRRNTKAAIAKYRADTLKKSRNTHGQAPANEFEDLIP